MGSLRFQLTDSDFRWLTQAHTSLHSQFEQKKPWRWLANEDFLCMCLWTQSMSKLNQKLTKSIVSRCSIWGVYMREIYLCKNLGVKEGGRSLPKKGVFSGTYSICMYDIFILPMLWNTNIPHNSHSRSLQSKYTTPDAAIHYLRSKYTTPDAAI